jgi:uncharacterized Fe-S cluster-containing radical SAM superfamily enzyme
MKTILKGKYQVIGADFYMKKGITRVNLNSLTEKEAEELANSKPYILKKVEKTADTTEVKASGKGK